MSDFQNTVETTFKRFIARVPKPIWALAAMWLMISLVISLTLPNLASQLPIIPAIILILPYRLMMICLGVFFFWRGAITIYRTIQSAAGKGKNDLSFTDTENSFGVLGALIILLYIFMISILVIRGRALDDIYGIAFSLLLSGAFGSALAFGRPCPRDVFQFLWMGLAVSLGSALLFAVTGPTST
jgi:hypothetical protein